MRFHRIHVELTNVCGLRCSFCPTGSRDAAAQSRHMSLAFFTDVIAQAGAHTREIACHVVGDPLTRPDLGAYLDIIHAHGLKAVLMTSGYFLRKHGGETLFHPAVKQLSVSMNAFNRNDTGWTLDRYLEPVLALPGQRRQAGSEAFINLRLWNLDADHSERAFNARLFTKLEHAFGVALDIDRVHAERPRSIRVAEKVLLHFDEYFEWPSPGNPVYGDGKCLGLSSHIAILSNGTVVPCCLDCDGVMALGDLHTERLDDVLRKDRVRRIREGFRHARAVEDLCQRCRYKDRFNPA